MNAVLYLNLLEILGEEQLKMLLFKITMCRNAVNSMLINVKTQMTLIEFMIVMKNTYNKI